MAEAFFIFLKKRAGQNLKVFQSQIQTSVKSLKEWLSRGKFQLFFATQLLLFLIKIVLQKFMKLQKFSDDSSLKKPWASTGKKLFSQRIMNKIFEANFRVT